MIGAWLVLAFVGGSVLGWIVGMRDRRAWPDQDCAVAEEDAHLAGGPRAESRPARRVREVFVGAEADEDEIKRRYGEDVVIHRSDR